jgi:hypothetical protein
MKLSDLKRDIGWVLYGKQMQIHDLNSTDTSRQASQNALDAVKDALDDIQLDNSGQYVIYTGIFDEGEQQRDIYGEHCWKGASISDDCSLCGEPYRAPVHQHRR